MGRLGLPGWLRYEPRLRMAGMGRLGFPGRLWSQSHLASGTPRHQVWQGGEDPQSWVLSALQTKTVTRSISQGWEQGQSTLQGHPHGPLTTLSKVQTPEQSQALENKQVWPGRQGRAGKGGHFGISRADT